MRTLRAALAAPWDSFELARIIAWSRVIATVIATTGMVLGASFVAVATSLD